MVFVRDFKKEFYDIVQHQVMLWTQPSRRCRASSAAVSRIFSPI